MMYTLLGILLPFTCVCYLTLIPLHDLIQYPEYWYEQILTSIGLVPLFSVYAIINCSAWMNISRIRSLKNIVFTAFAGLSSVVVTWTTGTLWWTNMGYYSPVPFSGLIAGYAIAAGEYFAVWFSFPRGWRKNGEFRKRLQYFLVSLALSQILTIQYNVIAKFLLVFKENYQWIIALSLPVFIEFNTWVVTLIATKASRGDIRSVEVVCSHVMGTRHALFLSYTLGSIATNTSSNIILATDHLIKLFMVMQLIRLKKKDPLNVEKQIDLVQNLIITQMLECVVPLVYCLCFCSAYLGPNSTLIGNVGNSYFQYDKVDDFEGTIKNIATFFLVEVCSLLSNSSLLWIFARINLYKALCLYVKEYGVTFTINLTMILYTVSFSIPCWGLIHFSPLLAYFIKII